MFYYTNIYMTFEVHYFLLQLLFLLSRIHISFALVSYIITPIETLAFPASRGDILETQCPALLKDHQSLRIKQYHLVKKKVDWAQPNSNPGSNKYNGICIVECRTRNDSENQERSSNHQEAQDNLHYPLCHTTFALDFIFFYCSTVIFFYLSSIKWWQVTS